MRQNFGIRASILHNSNKLYSSSFCDWRGVRDGAYFQFLGDRTSFNVLNTKLETYSKDFTIKNKNSVSVSFNFNPILIKNDIVSIHYREQRVNKLLFIINPGTDYRVGDMIFCLGGVINQDYQSAASFKVLQVSDTGGIIDLELIEHGKYVKTPENKEIKTYSDGPGQNAELALEFGDGASLTIIERTVSNIVYNPNESILIFSHPLPDGINTGQISFSKWLIHLNHPYILRNSNVIGAEYEINNDLIGTSGLMKINKNDKNVDSYINKNFELLNSRISELEEKIKLLTQNV